MIRVYQPSGLMVETFPTFKADVDKMIARHEKDQPYPDIIDLYNADGQTFLLVREAVRHTDDGFSYTALWVFRSYGHIFHTDNNRRKSNRIQQSRLLCDGDLIVFDPRRHHWTTGGAGVLAVMPFDFQGDDFPGQETVIEAIHEALKEGEE